MRIGDERHLTYCLNVHAGESWDACLAAIKRYVLNIRSRVAGGKAFGLGLRLSRIAADELSLPRRLDEFRSFLQKHDLYVFTVNGFPYGAFHGTEVKELVYEPDWRAAERVEYTNLLADILARLLPEGVMGSISTVPGMYGTTDEHGWTLIAENIAKCATHFAQIERDSGRHVMLALEPEPDCLFDSTYSTIAFLGKFAVADSVKALEFDWHRYLGVCVDTCHLSVVFDDPLESLRRLREAGISIPKVQLSAALRADSGDSAAAHLTEFAEAVYLHQVRIRHSDGSFSRYPDLSGEALRAVSEESGGEVRVHMHVPLYFEKFGVMQSTLNDIRGDFFAELRDMAIPHLEIETYTFDVLPRELASMPIEESIAREFEVVLELLRTDS